MRKHPKLTKPCQIAMIKDYRRNKEKFAGGLAFEQNKCYSN